MDKLEFVAKVTGVTLDADDAAAIYEACGYKDEALSGRSTIRNLKKRLSDANLRADKLSAALKKAEQNAQVKTAEHWKDSYDGAYKRMIAERESRKKIEVDLSGVKEKVEELNRENARLREEKQHWIEEYKKIATRAFSSECVHASHNPEGKFSSFVFRVDK